MLLELIEDCRVCNQEYPFPISLENLPRHTSFCCLPLKYGAIFAALFLILYSTFALAQCGSIIVYMPIENLNTFAFIVIILQGIAYVITFILSAAMLIGALKENVHLIRPWVVWSSIQVLAMVGYFVMWNTINVFLYYHRYALVIYVIEFMILMVRVYLLVLVASFFRELQEEKKETEKLKKLIDRDTWYTATL